VTDVRWVGNEKIAELLETITHACTVCGGPARVPEDVAVIRQVGEKLDPLVICEDCTPAFIEDLQRFMDEGPQT
jgi:hypothetical protein